MHTKRVLITGEKGFIGSNLLRFLCAQGFAAKGADLDIRDFFSIERVLKGKSWDIIIHLAGISHGPTCEKDPNLAYLTNLGGTVLLLEGIRRYQPRAHLIFASTAQVYAAPDEQECQKTILIQEGRKISPQNLYAQTKWDSELVIQDSANRVGFKSTVFRLFNHTHRSQSPDFFLPYLYSKMISKNQINQEKILISVGNLDLNRDIGSLSDLMSAFLLTVQTSDSFPQFDVFNICSGSAKNLRTLATELAKSLELNVEFKVDETRVRPNEPTTLCGSHNKFSKATGWKPVCTTEKDLIQKFLEIGVVND